MDTLFNMSPFKKEWLRSCRSFEYIKIVIEHKNGIIIHNLFKNTDNRDMNKIKISKQTVQNKQIMHIKIYDYHLQIQLMVQDLIKLSKYLTP